MGRLIVAHILPGDPEPVHGVVHERHKPMVGGFGGCEKIQSATITRSPKDFFPPIAEDIRTEAGIGLCAVVGGASVLGCVEKRHRTFSFGDPLFNSGAAEEFSEEIAVPPYTHVARPGSTFRNALATTVVQTL